MDVPYNNGKVSIGSAYYLNPLRRKYIEEDRDMLRLQQYLIYDPEINRRKYFIRRIFEWVGAFVLLVILLKGYQ
jgi:hypothetical protein